MTETKAIYAFSGDPITFGHMNVIDRASKIFKDLTVGIGMNPAKKYLFSLEERLELAKAALSTYKNIKVVLFRGLLVDYAFENNIQVIVRGLRNGEDFNMELLLHQIGESQKYNIETLFLPSQQNMSHISSGAAKALQLEQGFVFEYVPLNVKQKLEERLSGQHIVGMTGEIGTGKSYLCKQLEELGKKENIPVTVIDVDKIGHRILETQEEPIYQSIRAEIRKTFGDDIRTENGFIDRKKLGKIIFNDPQKLKLFNEIIYKPLILKLRRELYGKKGLILLDSALIAESQMAYLCNNNVVLVSCSKDTQLKRLTDRNYTEEQIRQRLFSQYTYKVKLDYIHAQISENGHGQIIPFENSGTDSKRSIQNLFESLVRSFTERPDLKT